MQGPTIPRHLVDVLSQFAPIESVYHAFAAYLNMVGAFIIEAL